MRIKTTRRGNECTCQKKHLQSLVVEDESTVCVLQKGMGGQHRVVRLNHGSGHLGRRRHREGELGLASIVNREALEEKGSETGSSTTSRGVEDEESLEASTVVGQLADSV